MAEKTQKSKEGAGFPFPAVRSDGTVDRSPVDARYPPLPPNPHFSGGVASKDVTIDPSTGTWARIYLSESASSTAAKLPILLYFHGGAFVLMSAASPPFHTALNRVAARLGVIVVSVEYRKAPEHRLPAAFDDCFLGLKWVQSQALLDDESSEAEHWVRSHGDFSSCFLMGHSAGGVIVHQVALRALAEGSGISPLRIRGIIPCVPSFGGTRGTASELAYGDRGAYTMKLGDTLRALAVPLGADEYHPYVNFKGPGTPDLSKVDLPPVLLVVGECDYMHDRQIEYAEALRKAGKRVTLVEFKGYEHLFFFPEVRDEDVDEAYAKMKQFLQECLRNN